MKLIGLGILLVLVMFWGMGVYDGSFVYQMDGVGLGNYTDYTLIIGLQAFLVISLIAIFLMVNKD